MYFLFGNKIIHGHAPNVTDINEIPCASQYEIKSFKVKSPMLPILLKFQVLLNLKIKYVKFNVSNVIDITDIQYTKQKSFMAMFPMLLILLIFHVFLIMEKVI